VRVDVLTIFPERLRSPLEQSILKRAGESGRLDVRLIDIREFATDRHRTVDDMPYGGGAGMVMKPEPLFRAVEQTRRHYHVHSERIYLAGFHEGATLAYRLGMTFPERFAGIIALNGVMPRRGGPLMRLPEVRRLRVLIGHGIANAVVPLEWARQDFRLLYTAGLSVRMHTYAANHRIHGDMLRDINRWVMQAISDEEHP